MLDWTSLLPSEKGAEAGRMRREVVEQAREKGGNVKGRSEERKGSLAGDKKIQRKETPPKLSTSQ